MDIFIKRRQAIFDPLEYFEKLKAAGAPEAQVNAFRDFSQSRQDCVRKELAAKKDLDSLGSELRLEMKSMGLRLLQWQIGIGAALFTAMAKGFHWFGF